MQTLTINFPTILIWEGWAIIIIDNDADVLMLPDTWLYPQSDEAYIVVISPAGYDFHLFPRSGSGGGIAFITWTNLSKFVTFRALDYTSRVSISVLFLLLVFACTGHPQAKPINCWLPHSFGNFQNCYPVMQTLAVMCPFFKTSIFISMTALLVNGQKLECVTSLHKLSTWAQL